MSYDATVYPLNVTQDRKPVQVHARTERGLRRKVERLLSKGCVLEAANVAEAHEIVAGLGLWPEIQPAHRPADRAVPEAVRVAASTAWARQEDRLAARDKRRLERPYLP